MFYQLNLAPLRNATGSKFNTQSIGNLVTEAIPWVFAFAGGALLLYLISGGFQIMFSRGEPKAVGEGKAKITNAFLGFVVVFISYWVTQAIGIIFNITSIQNIFR